MRSNTQHHHAPHIRARTHAHKHTRAHTRTNTHANTPPPPKVSDGAASAAAACERQSKQWLKWSAQNNPFKVSASWVNIAGNTQRSINQVAHNHLVYKTSVTGVYYATSGWSTAENATTIQLLRPSPFPGTLSAAALSIDPTNGTLLIFPTFLSHAADVHAGESNRISLAFNAIQA